MVSAALVFADILSFLESSLGLGDPVSLALLLNRLGHHRRAKLLARSRSDV